jgi:hypothetical protein
MPRAGTWVSIAALLGAICCTVAGLASAAPRERDAWPVYDALIRGMPRGFKDVPSDPAPGLHKMYWWGETVKSPVLTQALVFARVRAIPPTDAAPLIVLDIEDSRFPVDIRSSGKPAVDRTIAYLSNVADWIHAANPHAKVGFYPVVFGGEREIAPEYLGQFRKWNPAWRNNAGVRTTYDGLVAANRYLRPIVEKVDLLIPAFYTFRQNPFHADVLGGTPPHGMALADNGWYGQMAGYMTMVRKDLGISKPVCPFIWAQYHDIAAASIRGKYLPLPMWRQQVQFTRYNTQCSILFGAGEAPPQSWASFAPWLQVVLKASRTHDVTPPPAPSALIGRARTKTANDLSQVVLSWSGSTDEPNGSGVEGYRVYRDGVLVIQTPATSFRDTSPLSAGTHTYWVVAVDMAGNTSGASNQAGVHVR